MTQQDRPKRQFRYFSRRLLLSVVAIVVIVYFLPRDTKLVFIYEVGKPWNSAQIIAPYDFPIYKDAELLKRERDSVLTNYQPYYDYKAQVAEENIAKLYRDFKAGKMGEVPANYLPAIASALREVYAHGVVRDEDLNRLQTEGNNSIRMVQGKEALATPVKVLFSSRSAYMHVMTTDTTNLRHELMLRCNINQYIEPNLVYDAKKSEAVREDLLSAVSELSGVVMNGQKIIDRGEIVDQQKANILLSLQKEEEGRTKSLQEIWTVYVGQVLLVGILFVLLQVYLHLYRRGEYDNGHSLLLLFSLLIIFPVLTSLMVEYRWFSVYILPYVMAAIFIRIFLDARTALISYVLLILISSLALHLPYRFVLFELIIGLVALFAVRELTERSQLLKATLIVTLTGLFFGVAESLSQGVSLQTLDARWFIHVMIQGVFLLFAYPLMFLVEKLFGFTSSVTLVELSNTNHPLLRRMSVEAQGTFNHSMQVANLAAEVANKIEAKVQLVRTGALYHDIGKMCNPAFFTENQSGTNPHDHLSEEKSAEIIIGHVTEGVKMAAQYGLPRELRDFILTHHGKGKVKYFYIQYCNKHPEEQVDEAMFTYPGPNPSTREQAILMMCDAVEATSRSLKVHDEENITKLVNTIIDEQVKEGFFNECPITFKDINDTKHVLIESLKTIYHTRITYPELNKGKSKERKEEFRPFFFGKRRP